VPAEDNLMTMKLQFDAHQDFQLQAIEAVADLFEGQARIEAGLTFSPGASSFAAVPNRLDLGDGELLHNLQAVQQRNGITPDPDLRCIEERVETGNGPTGAAKHSALVPSYTAPKDVRFYNFSAEMETGTGKTYVYLRTILELCRRYGMRKFVVVVPSVAIREGVLKTLQTGLPPHPLRGLPPGVGQAHRGCLGGAGG
jgi:type III restriction enzyme